MAGTTAAAPSLRDTPTRSRSRLIMGVTRLMGTTLTGTKTTEGDIEVVLEEASVEGTGDTAAGAAVAAVIEEVAVRTAVYVAGIPCSTVTNPAICP